MHLQPQQHRLPTSSSNSKTSRYDAPNQVTQRNRAIVEHPQTPSPTRSLPEERRCRQEPPIGEQRRKERKPNGEIKWRGKEVERSYKKTTKQKRKEKEMKRVEQEMGAARATVEDCLCSSPLTTGYGVHPSMLYLRIIYE